VSDELGMPVPASRSGSRPCGHGSSDDPKAGLFQPIRAVRKQSGLAPCGLTDHQVVAVARGEQGSDPLRLFEHPGGGRAGRLPGRRAPH